MTAPKHEPDSLSQWHYWQYDHHDGCPVPIRGECRCDGRSIGAVMHPVAVVEVRLHESLLLRLTMRFWKHGEPEFFTIALIRELNGRGGALEELTFPGEALQPLRRVLEALDCMWHRSADEDEDEDEDEDGDL